MATQSFDILVIGCGGFGSATMSHLARRGLRVLGIDQFHPPHDQGSSHGETRVIRKAYFEHPNYVPLLHRAYELWDELTDRTAHHRRQDEHELFNRCGLLLAGPARGEVIAGARESASQQHLQLNTLSHRECHQRFPMFRIPDALDIVFEQDAGYLWVERCVAAHLQDAFDHGAVLMNGKRVVELSWRPDSVTVRTSTVECFHAGAAVVTAGAWTAQLLSSYSNLIRVRRKTLFWLPIRKEVWAGPHNATIHLFDVPALDNSQQGGQFYGFPSVDGQSIKLAEHTGGDDHCEPSTIDRSVKEAEADRVRRYTQQYLSGVIDNVVRSCVCYYAMSPDGHFLIDRLPNSPVVVASGFSGHGFKFTSVMGEALADLVQQGQTQLPVSFLSSNRIPSG